MTRDGRWSKHSDQCQGCGTYEREHWAHELCGRCYAKEPQQKAHARWYMKQSHYQEWRKEYLATPEGKAKHQEQSLRGYYKGKKKAPVGTFSEISSDVGFIYQAINGGVKND